MDDVVMGALGVIGACLLIAAAAVALVLFRPSARRRRRRRRHAHRPRIDLFSRDGAGPAPDA